MKNLKLSTSLALLLCSICVATTSFANEKFDRAYREAEPEVVNRFASSSWRNTEKARVAVSLPVNDYMQAFEDAPQHNFESKSYAFKVSGAELQKGTSIKTTAPGAIVRINRVDAMGQAQAVLPEHFYLSASNGAEQKLINASEKLQRSTGASDPALPDLGMAFKVSAEHGAGKLILRAEKALNASGDYFVQVYEPQSDYRLQAEVQQKTVFNGESLKASAALLKMTNVQGVSNVSATLIAPDGRRISMQPSVHGKQIVLDQLMAYPASEMPGLWEVEWKVSGKNNGLEIERHIRTAFAHGEKSAVLAGSVKSQKVFKQPIVKLLVPVHVSKAGRFEVRATASSFIDGQSYPAQLLSTAQWLEPGKNMMVLELDRAQLKAAGVRGILAIENLQLLDQTQMLAIAAQENSTRLSQRRWY